MAERRQTDWPAGGEVVPGWAGLPEGQRMEEPGDGVGAGRGLLTEYTVSTNRVRAGVGAGVVSLHLESWNEGVGTLRVTAQAGGPKSSNRDAASPASGPPSCSTSLPGCQAPCHPTPPGLSLWCCPGRCPAQTRALSAPFVLLARYWALGRRPREGKEPCCLLSDAVC